ncbi:MAG TPA: hypothetical protein PK637_05605 [Flavobacteriales bacterium]|nr:hypothetical protein [Flavobacteriales bacterium]HRE96221.1 hypothetical protein [Flavobacteriales bacterium]HRJ36009.1 hypothetical protein [Flavobacteriales bacterium]HRJ38411.1 hypothetical protein [Flavobacteriales bacterium]
MKRRQLQLLISAAVLITLSVVVVYMKQKKSNSTFTKDLSDFTIEDTASIGKLKITNQDKISAELVRKHAGYWELNGKFRARVDAIDLMLTTAKKVRVKNPVPESARENIIRNLSVNYHKVEYFDLNGKAIKTWYVGHATKDHDASYMLLETPSEGKSSLPYVTYIPGFAGELSSRYFCVEEEWRFTGIFNYDPSEIIAVSIRNNDYPEESFEVKVLDKNLFALHDQFGKKVERFDTAGVRQLVVNFKKIHFETLNRGILSPLQEDSLRKAKPYYEISVTDKKGEKKEIKVFHKKLPPHNMNNEPFEQDYPYDPERAFAQIPGGEIVVIQFFVFDKILWPIDAFLPRKE